MTVSASKIDGQSKRIGGIGTKFFDIAREQAIKSGHDKFCVAVNIKNYEAQKFYIAMGGNVLRTDGFQMHLSFIL